MENRNERHRKYISLLNNRRWWGEVRVNQLRSHPLCQICQKEGLLRSAVDVHHIKPVEAATDAVGDTMEDRCYNPNNLISLCVECHIKIHKQMKSHQGQMARQMPKEDNEETRNLGDWVSRVSGGRCEARPKIKKGIRRTKYGWMTAEQMKQRQQQNMQEWINNVSNGHLNTQTTPSVDAGTED